LLAALKASIPADASGLVVALSGGADSAALLAAVADIAKDSQVLPLRAVHVDHGLQDCAQEFRSACQNLCERLQVPLRIISVEVASGGGRSIEAAAREARYAALAAQLAPQECLLTAHHRKDQAETLLLQALRGAGVKGLAAMPACRELGAGWHVRPLLDVAHGELLTFGAHLDEFVVADPMNGDLRFDRSYLRSAVWPAIEKRWPGADVALARSARHMAEAQQLLEIAARAEVARLRDGAALSVPGLRALSGVQQINTVRLWLHSGGVEAPPTARLQEALRQILEAQEDHQPTIAWGEVALRRYRQRLFLTQAQAPQLTDEISWTVQLHSTVPLGAQLGELTWIAQQGGIATDRLPAAVSVRRRVGGETLKLKVSAKTQSIQHLCQSHGVLPWLRDALPLVYAGDELIAVGDLWTDARWSAAPGSPGLAIAWNHGPWLT
jgi:tRNA(Ile)-lysidine synthase